MQKLYEWTHPNEPWISQGAIRFCREHLNRRMVGVEWGSGRSTAWFAQRLSHLTSVEHDRQWSVLVRKRLTAAACKNVNYLHVPLNHDESEPTGADYDPLPDYVSVIQKFGANSLDFVVVDGHYRMACVKSCLEKIKSGGLLLIDNTDWMPLHEWGVPQNWSIVHQSSNARTQTTIWKKPDAVCETDILN